MLMQLSYPGICDIATFYCISQHANYLIEKKIVKIKTGYTVCVFFRFALDMTSYVHYTLSETILIFFVTFKSRE